jgi:hypothetical protein
MVSVVAMGVSAGCATPAVVRLVPNAGEVLWVSGRASVAREEGGIRVATAFDHQDGDALGIRVEVDNGTKANLDLDPHEFTFTTCRDPALATCGPTHRVIDPEETLDEQQWNQQAAASNSQLLVANAQQAMWSNEALRHNTVLPGGEAAGLVFVPVDPDAGVVWFHVRTGGHVFSFPFRQVITSLTPPEVVQVTRPGQR